MKSKLIYFVCMVPIFFALGNSFANASVAVERPIAQLERNLEIGRSDKQAKFALASIRSIQVDNLSNIYVLDSKDNKVKVYDENGNLKVSFGARGQGPGELQNAISLFLDDRHINIFDFGNKRISEYSLDGRFITDMNLGTLGGFFIPEAMAGNIVFGKVMKMEKDGDTFLRLVKYVPGTNEMAEISRTKKDDVFPKVNPISNTYLLRTRRDGSIVWCYTGKYQIFVMSPDERIIAQINRKFDPKDISEDDKKDLLIKIYGSGGNLPAGISIAWPEYFSPIQSLLTDERGWIYAMICEKNNAIKARYDVFDDKGSYQGYFISPNSEKIEVVRNGSAFCAEEDSNGMPILVRYRIRWVQDINR